MRWRRWTRARPVGRACGRRSTTARSRPSAAANGRTCAWEADVRIGIIGAGQIGGTLTRRLRALGHEVLVANSRGPETLRDLAAETGAKAVSVTEAAQSGELVVVTIPLKNVPKLPRGLFERVPDSVVVVDTGNYYPR